MTTIIPGLTSQSENTTGASPAVLSVYQNPEFKVRGLVREGEPWFVAKDVCDVLGLSNSRKAVADHLEEEERGVTFCDTPGGRQEMTIISESGLYALIFRSSKPEARAFRRWVTGEVLPAIRREGVYRLRSLDMQRIKELEAAVAGARQSLEKKVEAYWRAQEVEGQYSINVWCAALGLELDGAQRTRLSNTLRAYRATHGFATGWQANRKSLRLGGRERYPGAWQRVRTWPPEHLAAALREHGHAVAEPDPEALHHAELAWRKRFEVKTVPGQLPAGLARRDARWARAREERALAEASARGFDITHGQEVRA